MTAETRWRAGVIAAGAGERLRAAGAPLKPLVRIGGATLIERVLGSLAEVNPTDVVIIVNDEAVGIREYISARSWPFAIRWIVQTTPSSMHSFLLVVEALAGGGADGPFLISTVDTVAAPGEYAAFADASRQLQADAVLAVATEWDDEKPLLVEVDARQRVMCLGDAARGSAPERVFATTGYYAVRSTVLREAPAARAAALPALRAFFGRLVASGYDVAAVPVRPSVDVDRPADISAAEAFLKQVRA